MTYKCPSDGEPLKTSGNCLKCPKGHKWRVGEGGRLRRVHSNALTPRERLKRRQEFWDLLTGKD